MSNIKKIILRTFLFLFLLFHQTVTQTFDVKTFINVPFRDCSQLFPSTVAVFSKDMVCTGGLLNSRWVLVPGHCIDIQAIKQKKVIVRSCFGCNKTNIQSSYVARAVLYGNYTQKTLKDPNEVRYDIGLLRLRQSLKKKNGTAYSLLPLFGYASTCNHGFAMTVSGPSTATFPDVVDRQLMCKYLAFGGLQSCKEKWPNSDPDSTTICAWEFLSERQVCKDNTKGIMYCGGTLTGVYANKAACDADMPTALLIYSRVENYIDFLKKYAGGTQQNKSQFYLTILSLVVFFNFIFKLN